MLTNEELVLLEQEGLTLAQAARMFPSGTPGKRIHPSAVWRWCVKGFGNGVRLQSVVVGGRRYTTRRWLQEFIDARTLDAMPQPHAFPEMRTPAQRRRAAERAGRQLDAILWPAKKR